MGFSSIQFTGGSAALQPQIIELLNKEHRDYIQTSSGLCVKATPQELKGLFAQNKIANVQVAPVEGETTPDVQAFMAGR